MTYNIKNPVATIFPNYDKRYINDCGIKQLLEYKYST